MIEGLVKIYIFDKMVHFKKVDKFTLPSGLKNY